MTPLKQELARLKELRERAAPPPWKTRDGFQAKTSTLSLPPRSYGGLCEWRVLHQDDAEFIKQSANHWLSLIEALEVAVETVEWYKTYHCMTIPGTDKLIVPDETETGIHAYQALAKIEQLICGSSNPVKDYPA